MKLTALRNIVLTSAILTAPAVAEGDEKLGPAGITLAKGSHVIHAGAGLNGKASTTFEVAIPASASIKQVIAYWEGMHNGENSHGATDALTVGGQTVTGKRIGGATRFFFQVWSSSYRADITNLGVVSSGENTITVAGMDFDYGNDGFGLMVIVDDGSGLRDIQVHDGNDTAYYFFGEPLKYTKPVTYSFAAHTAARTAQLGFQVGDVEPNRTTVVDVMIDGQLQQQFHDVFGSGAGGHWDALSLDVEVPAGATSLSVEVRSFDMGLGRFAGGQEASLVWVASSLTLGAPAANNNCSVDYWLANQRSWPCGLRPSTPVGRVFGFRPGYPRFAPGLAARTMADVLENGGNGASTLAGQAGDMLQQAIATYLNGRSGRCRTISSRCLVYRVRIVLHIVNCNPTRAALLTGMTKWLDRLNSRCCKPTTRRCGSKRRRRCRR